jgi:hypothetical protein
MRHVRLTVAAVSTLIIVLTTQSRTTAEGLGRLGWGWAWHRRPLQAASHAAGSTRSGGVLGLPLLFIAALWLLLRL